MTKICVIGLGYIGFPTACMFALNGVEVVGIDINQEIVKTLQNGKLHIHEKGLDQAAHEAFQSGRFKISDRIEEADAFIIAVPTPFYDDKRADMRAVTSATESILPVLQSGNLVILESTSPPKTTTDLVQPILEKSGLIAGKDFYLAYSPERVLPGQILHELIENDRVIGGIDFESAQAGRNLYEVFVKGKIILTNSTTAEMVKLMENTFRDVNIAIANEFSRLGERFGIDIYEAINLANRHPRVNILNPGPGVGGHCISVDPWFLVEAAPDTATLIRTARQVNDSQPAFIVEFIRKVIGCLAGKKIAVLGLSYKPNVDDLRESPAIEVVRLLLTLGAKVKAFEPNKLDAKIDGIVTTSSLLETVNGADMVLLLVNHSQFQDVKPEEIQNYMRTKIVVDATNSWKENDWVNGGFVYFRFGSGLSKTYSPEPI